MKNFSLVEFLIVLIISAILISGVVFLYPVMKTRYVEEISEKLKMDLIYASEMATMMGKGNFLYIMLDSLNYIIAYDSEPDGVIDTIFKRVEISPPHAWISGRVSTDTIFFFSNGFSSGGFIKIISDKREKNIQVFKTGYVLLR